MMRISLRPVLGSWLRPLAVDLHQKSSVCSTCQALASLHRQQLQRQQQQQDRHQQLARESQPRRRLQVYSPLWRAPEAPDVKKGKAFENRAAWTYKGPHGVEHWAELFGKSCSGKFQSPVDLSPLATKQDSKLNSFHFTNFDNVAGVVQQLENNGHTVQVSYQSGDLRVSGGGLRSEYRVVQFHFHWGSDNTKGSEHTISGVPYPMEMHVVTYNLNYDNFTNALNYADGLAVLGVFFEVGSTEKPSYAALTNSLPLVRKPGSSVPLTPVPLGLLMPDDTKHYYRYQGGLTTPPCSEVVTWTLFKQPVAISSNQMDAFRKLESIENGPMVDNFRPTQPLHGREIKTSF